MKVTRITYSKKFPYAPYLNEAIGFEADVYEGEDILQAIQELREKAETSFTLAHPTVVLTTKIEQVLSKKEIKQSNIEAIINSKSIQELETYKLLKNDKDIFHAYNVREKELLKK